MSKDKPRMRLLLLIFAAAVAWEIFAFLRFPSQAWIQGLTEAWFVSRGLLFYRDFLGTYTPLLRLLMVPIHNVFGYTQETTLYLAPITFLAVLCLLLIISLKYLSGWTRIVPLLFFSFWDPFLGENHFTTPVFLGLVTLLTLLLWFWWTEKPSAKRALLVGISCAVGVSSMQILTPFAFVVLLSLLILGFYDKQKYSHFLIGILGFLIIVVPLGIWFSASGILSDFVYWVVIYHFTTYPYTSFGKSTSDIVVFLAVHSPLLLISISFLKAAGRYDRRTKLVQATLILMLLSLVIPIWFAIFHPVRFQMSLPILSFTLGLCLMQVLGSHKKASPVLVASLVMVATVNILAIKDFAIPRLKRNLSHPRNKLVLTKLYPDDPMYSAVDWVRKNTPDNARLFVIGDPLFYLESERLPSSVRATTNIPVVYEPLDQLKSELSANTPSYWVVDERGFRRFKEFGYEHLVPPFQKLLECQKVEVRFDYWTIRKHVKIDPSCLP